MSYPSSQRKENTQDLAELTLLSKSICQQTVDRNCTTPTFYKLLAVRSYNLAFGFRVICFTLYQGTTNSKL